MNKKELTEADIRTKFITPALVPPLMASGSTRQTVIDDGKVKLRVEIEAVPKNGLTDQQIEETKAALRGLGD